MSVTKLVVASFSSRLFLRTSVIFQLVFKFLKSMSRMTYVTMTISQNKLLISIHFAIWWS